VSGPSEWALAHAEDFLAHRAGLPLSDRREIASMLDAARLDGVRLGLETAREAMRAADRAARGEG
jgi:hypothetical protein